MSKCVGRKVGFFKIYVSHDIKHGTLFGINTVKAEYMADLQVVSEYNSHMFCSLPNTLRRQLLKGKSGFDRRSTAHAQSGHEAKLRRICLKTGSGQ